MNELQIFKNAEFGEVRAVAHEGQPWFVAKDVCDNLGLDTSNLSKMLDEDEKGTYSIRTPGGPQEMSIISEPGLYSLVLRSRKPEAKRFKRWIVHEVIPSIRKTGGYMLTKADDTPEAIMARSVLVAQATFERLKSHAAKLESRVEERRRFRSSFRIVHPCGPACCTAQEERHEHRSEPTL